MHTTYTLVCFCLLFCYLLSSFVIHPYLFFFNDTATTEIYTLSLHDALPICSVPRCPPLPSRGSAPRCGATGRASRADRKSTRLNSSHSSISYAVFCLKKKKTSYYQFISKTKKKRQHNLNDIIYVILIFSFSP